MSETDPSSTPAPAPASASGRTPESWWRALWRRHRLLGFFLVIIWPNALWSVANLVYNDELIVEGYGDVDGVQGEVFWRCVPIYTTFTWVAGLAICCWLIHPVHVYLRARDGHGEITPAIREAAQRRLVNLPRYQLWCNFCLWMPGGIYFPFLICTLGSTHEALTFFSQFLASFAVSAMVTTFQTFVLLERFLVEYYYADVFTDIRPAQVTGAKPMTFRVRLWLLWGAVSMGPVIVLALVTVRLLFLLFDPEGGDEDSSSKLPLLTAEVIVFSLITGAVIFWVVGKDLGSWLDTHIRATREIANDNFDVRIAQLRSDEWGGLTDSFNTMAKNLSHGREVHEKFGQYVGPEVRDEVLKTVSEPGGTVKEITVMFADIRGFTRYAAGKAPGDVVELLNRFFSLGEQAVEEGGGFVNKFLGDGFMALFGTPVPRANHPDLAVAAARDFLVRLAVLNQELVAQGQPPLKIGIGIHTGPALCGRIGATVPLPNGRPRMRLEFTAIGETVNFTQRIEELTKKCGETLLISEATRDRLQSPVGLACLGPQEIRGSETPMVVYRVAGDGNPPS